MSEQKTPYGDAKRDIFQRETRPTLREPHGENFRMGLMEGVFVLSVKRSRWKMRAAVVGVLALLLLLATVVLMSTDVQARVSMLAVQSVPTVQPTPTEDATVTTLNKQKLAQEVKQLENQNEPDPLGWLRTNASIFLSTLAVVIGGLFGLWRWRVDRKEAQDKELENREEAQDKELKDRQAERERRDEEQQRWLKSQETEREKRAEERFQSVVMGLGDERVGAQVGAAILLRTFLRPGYEQFYTQAFDLAVANLRRRGASKIVQHQLWNAPQNLDTAFPLTTLDQALIVVFKEAFPLARDWEKKEPEFLDATGVQLDNAFLAGADLKQIWGPWVSLRKANLVSADLSGAILRYADLREATPSGTIFFKADLSGADFRGAYLGSAILSRTQLQRANLSGADLNGADLSFADLIDADLSGANLHGANLHGASLHGANLSGADLTVAALDGAFLCGAHLSGSYLIGATLRGADLSDTDLSGAHLSDAHLSEADLIKVTLDGVDLRVVSLIEACLTGVYLTGARGLTKEQRTVYRAQGAFVDQEAGSNASQGSVSTSPRLEPKSAQLASLQEAPPTSDVSQSDGVPSQVTLDQSPSGEAGKGDEGGRTSQEYCQRDDRPSGE